MMKLNLVWQIAFRSRLVEGSLCTVQPIMYNIRVANWQIKVWQISSIHQSNLAN